MRLGAAKEARESAKCKRSQLFIRTHNETLSVAAMRVSDKDCSPFAIHSCDAAPTPSGFAEIVSDDFPIRQRSWILFFYCPNSNDKIRTARRSCTPIFLFVSKSALQPRVSSLFSL